MDDVDRSMVKMLLHDSRRSLRDLAGELGISATAVHKRMKALTESGVITRFAARPNPSVLGCISVLVHGRSDLGNVEDITPTLKNNEFTLGYSPAGGNNVYISAYLPDLSLMEQYMDFVKEEVKIVEPMIGIQYLVRGNNNTKPRLTHLDYRIINELRYDSRRSYSDLAGQLGVSPKTVRRRLKRLLENEAVFMTLDLAPERSDCIFATIHLRLKEGIDRAETVTMLNNDFSEAILRTQTFANLHALILLAAWFGSMKEMNELMEELKNQDLFCSMVPNIIYSFHYFPSWIDRTIEERATSAALIPKNGGAGRGKENGHTIMDVLYLKELDAYRGALNQALEDGIITDDEEAILGSLRDSLEISDEEHSALLDMIRAKSSASRREFNTYRNALNQALEDGVITHDEEAILLALRDALNISDKEHEKILRKITNKK